MFLFKTSGLTFNSVVQNEKHAFKGMPKNWYPGELVLISKNKVDCERGERQIQYTMKLRNIRQILPGEAEKFWPGNEGRWKYLIECDGTKEIAKPFNLDDVLGINSLDYAPVVTFKKMSPGDERRLETHLQVVGTF